MIYNYSFVVLKYLLWNELTFLVTYDVIMNVSSEAAVRRCSSKEVFLNILQYSQEDAFCWSLFWPAALLKRDSNTGVFL